MIPWIISNIDSIAIALMVAPIAASGVIGLFLILDDYCAELKWYGKIMYGSCERDQELADAFFGKAFISLGIADITVPFAVIYGYLYVTGKPLSALWGII